MRSKIVVFGFFFLVISLVAFVINYKSTSIDEETGCVEDVDVSDVTVIIFDQSDRFESADIERSKSILESIISSSKGNEKLLFVEPNENLHYEPLVHFDMCSPKNISEINVLFDSPDDVERKFSEFRKNFYEKVEVALSRDVANYSPIFETIGYVAMKSDYINAKNRKIYIFSDMMQNSLNFNFYKKIPKYRGLDIKSIPMHDFKLYSTDIYTVHVSRRPNWEDRNNVKIFWNDLFGEKRATVHWDYDFSSDRDMK